MARLDHVDDGDLRQVRMPPHNVEAEQNVLGGVMLSPEAFDTISGSLTEEDFYRRDHRAIWRAIRDLADRNKPFDVVTLGEWFESQGQAELVDGGAYLLDVVRNTHSAANIAAYAEIVREKAQLRQLIELGTQMVNSGFQPEGRPARDILAEASTTLFQVAGDPKVGGSKSMREISSRWFANFLKRYQGDDSIKGLMTPWSGFNGMTRGLKRQELSVVAGRPSMGKSQFAINASLCAAGRKANAFFVSLEMGDESIFTRMLANAASIEVDWLQHPRKLDDLGNEVGDDDEIKQGRMTAAMRELVGATLRIDDDGGLNIEQIIARARREHRLRPIDLLVIDHLHLMELPGNDSQAVEYGGVTRRLKALAKELNCHVMLLAQLNRALESRPGSKRPTMADLRASGNIEQDADLIVLLYRDDYYAERENRPSEYPGLVEYMVAKQRDGKVGRTWAEERFAYGRLADYDGPTPQPVVQQDQQKPKGPSRSWDSIGRGQPED